MAMTHLKISSTFSKKMILLLAVLAAVLALLAAIFGQLQGESLIIENQESREVYLKVPVKTGDEVSFEWEHSFEHIPWNEYYEVMEDKTFLLHTISVAGFGAGIPAEMDCTYRYEDGLVYMDNIESEFPRFNWINSQTALKKISLNGTVLITGADMPHHKKVTLYIK